MDLETLLQLVRDVWPQRFEKGRVIHVAANNVSLQDGSTVHCRILIQRTVDAPDPPQAP